MHTESQWRYRAKRLGFRLVRYGQSVGQGQYGPYGLVDRTTGRLVASRLEPEDVERLLFADHDGDDLRALRLRVTESDDG
jgi:hypothetical protein